MRTGRPGPGRSLDATKLSREMRRGRRRPRAGGTRVQASLAWKQARAQRNCHVKCAGAGGAFEPGAGGVQGGLARGKIPTQRNYHVKCVGTGGSPGPGARQGRVGLARGQASAQRNCHVKCVGRCRCDPAASGRGNIRSAHASPGSRRPAQRNRHVKCLGETGVFRQGRRRESGPASPGDRPRRNETVTQYAFGPASPEGRPRRNETVT